jgi:hypothetical protein
MESTTLANLLTLVKIDLGITHNLRDEYFVVIIQSAKTELERMGIVFDATLPVDDMQLIVDYSVWSYRKRQEDVGLGRNIRFRIHNRLIGKAGVVIAES